MKNEFIPYEQALALKELGFDEPCFGYYLDNEFQFFADVRSCNTNSEFGFYPTALTYSQAFRWFREKYKLEAIVQKADDFSWYKFTIYFYLSDSKGFVDSYHEFNTYEEAELACLIKLIEIVKEKK
jgi:hypothetical protein